MRTIHGSFFPAQKVRHDEGVNTRRVFAEIKKKGSVQANNGRWYAAKL